MIDKIYSLEFKDPEGIIGEMEKTIKHLALLKLELGIIEAKLFATNDIVDIQKHSYRRYDLKYYEKMLSSKFHQLENELKCLLKILYNFPLFPTVN